MKKPKNIILHLIVPLAGLLLGACAGIDTINQATPTPERIQPAPTNDLPTTNDSPLLALNIPPYYSEGYVEIVKASQNEQGLVIFSDLSLEQWRPVIRAFNGRYPWVNVSIVAPQTPQIFESYYSQNDLTPQFADLITSTDAIAWYKFSLGGELLPYRPEEALYLPVWATKNLGIYPMSIDPALIIHYKNLNPVLPTNILSIGNLIKKSPETYQERIGTLDPNANAKALLLNWVWTQTLQENGWEQLENVGQARPILFASEDELIQSVIRGSSRIGYFVPSTSVFSQMTKYPNLAYSYIQDHQPLFINYIGITRNAKNQNSAKLMVDFVLSQDGQVALAEGGIIPYRSDIASVVNLHFEQIEKAVGVENLIFLDIDAALIFPQTVSDFLNRWNTSMHRPAGSE